MHDLKMHVANFEIVTNTRRCLREKKTSHVDFGPRRQGERRKKKTHFANSGKLLRQSRADSTPRLKAFKSGVRMAKVL